MLLLTEYLELRRLFIKLVYTLFDNDKDIADFIKKLTDLDNKIKKKRNNIKTRTKDRLVLGDGFRFKRFDPKMLEDLFEKPIAETE